MDESLSSRWRIWLLACPARIRWLACGFHCVLIALLSLLPAWIFPPSATQVPGLDKVMHLGMYGLLGALLRWAANPGESSSPRVWLPAAAIGYGALMEVLQLVLGGGTRMFSAGDIMANGVGVVLFWWWTGWRLRKPSIR